MCQRNILSSKFTEYTQFLVYLFFLINKLLFFLFAGKMPKIPAFGPGFAFITWPCWPRNLQPKGGFWSPCSFTLIMEIYGLLKMGQLFQSLRICSFWGRILVFMLNFHFLSPFFRGPILIISPLMLFDLHLVLEQCYTSFSPFSFVFQIWSFLF